MSSSAIKLTVLPGDGIGPEVVASALKIISAAGVTLDADVQVAGAAACKRGVESGVPA